VNEIKYFNFPIYFLEGFLNNSQACLENILYYSLYYHSMKLELGSDFEDFKSSANFYNVSLGDATYAFEKGEQLYNEQIHGSPKVGINTQIFWYYYKYQKSDFQKMCLLGFLAIKSILQQKTYCKITNNYWYARMDGKAKSCHEKYLSEEIKMYRKRYWVDKIKNELINKWNLCSYGRYIRGFYVSFKLNLTELAFEVEKKKVINRGETQRMLNRTAYRHALQRLYDEKYLDTGDG